MWKLAWRNLWRNRTRTMITGSAIALTMCLRLCTVGMAEDQYETMNKGMLKGTGGSVIVHGEGYWASLSPEYVVSDPATVMAEARKLEHVEAAIPRVLMQALLSTGYDSTGVGLAGISLDDEGALVDYGRYVEKGEFLSPTQEQPLLLGKGIVKKLELELGDEVRITVSDPEGEPQYAKLKLVGIVDMGSTMANESVAFTTLEVAQKAGNLGSAVTQIGLVLDDDEHKDTVRDGLLKRLCALDGKREWVAATDEAPANCVRPGVEEDKEARYKVAMGVEVLSWMDARPEIVGMIETDEQWNNAISFFILVIVLFVIVNTFLMAVLERVRELGLLAALGLTPQKVQRLMLAEGVLLGAVFSAVGLALGLFAHFMLVEHGIDMRDFGAGDIEMSGVVLEDFVIRSKLNPLQWAANVGLIFYFVLLAAWYPSRRAAKLLPAEAMRTYE